MSAKSVNKSPAQTVSKRQWIRLFIVYLLIPLLLFICSGDPRWWQAWLYAVLIMASRYWWAPVGGAPSSRLNG